MKRLLLLYFLSLLIFQISFAQTHEEQTENCVCKQQFQRLNLGEVDLPPGKVFVELVLSEINCRTGDCKATLLCSLDKPVFKGLLKIRNKVAVPVTRVSIHSDKPDCGKSVTFHCHAIISSTFIDDSGKKSIKSITFDKEQKVDLE